jgi:hypothetical protein
MTKTKGQEEAPFELLIATILMGFIIVVGIIAMQRVMSSQCDNQTYQELQKLKTHIEKVVQEKTPLNFTFSLPHCYENEEVKFRTVSDQAICSRLCEEFKRDCVILDYTSKGAWYQLCVKVPITTYFAKPADIYCEDRTSEKPKQVLVDMYDSIQDGIYQVQYKGGESYPVICAYMKKP